MATPGALFLDTDVLIQLYISKSQNILGHLKKDYGVFGLVVPEVSEEISFNRKFHTRFQKEFRRSCQAGWIQVLDANTYATIVSSNAELQKCATGVSYADIEMLGRDYNIRIDRGEAYTHGAAIMLSQPVASNDMNALKVLIHNQCKLPSPVFRTFDLIVFAYQAGYIDQSRCNDIRKALLAENERLPIQWKNASFQDGLKTFRPRLVDSAAATVGATPSAENQSVHTTSMVITKI